MEQNTTNPTPNPRRGAPLWVQVLVWVGLLGLLVLLALGLLRAQHPIISSGKKVPDFSLTLFDNYKYQGAGKVGLTSLRGKVVLVNFWASWCVTCADEADIMESAWQYYQPAGKVVFLGVDYTDVDAKALDFLARYKITYPNGPDLGTRITPIFNRNIAMPETYLIDQQGILRYKQIGPFQSLAEIQAAVDPILNGR
jgi:cytochrome c biogenesis protein CcmG/thiol:disulfide interchange protein DsbE